MSEGAAGRRLWLCTCSGWEDANKTLCTDALNLHHTVYQVAEIGVGHTHVLLPAKQPQCTTCCASGTAGKGGRKMCNVYFVNETGHAKKAHLKFCIDACSWPRRVLQPPASVAVGPGPPGSGRGDAGNRDGGSGSASGLSSGGSSGSTADFHGLQRGPLWTAVHRC